MSRILITGGAGFIGSRLCKHLVAQGHTVSVLDSLLPQVHGQIPEASPLMRATQEVAAMTVGDVTNREALSQALEGQEIVVHLAAETGTGQSMYEIERYSRVNVGGTALLLDILANNPRRSVTKLVVASSRSIYGEGRYYSNELGFVYPPARRENDLREGRFEPTYEGDKSGLTKAPTPEDAEIRPSSVYGITKHTQESLVRAVAPTIGIAPVALRYQNVYGPGQSLSNPYTGILSIFSSLILEGRAINVFEDGLETRDFVFVDDVVRVTAQACIDPRADGQVFNVGSGIATSVNEVVSELLHAYQRQVPVQISGNFRIGDIRHNVADLTRASAMLGFTPMTSFSGGVRHFAEWVRMQTVSASAYEQSLSEMRERRLLQ